MRIVFTTTQAPVNQINPVWQGVYIWLIENTSDVCLIVRDEDGLIGFEGGITCIVDDNDMARFDFDNTIVIVTVAPFYGDLHGSQVQSGTVELSHSHSFDMIARAIRNSHYFSVSLLFAFMFHSSVG